MTDITPRSVQQLFDLKGKIALVTGGSRGLGLQMAHALGEAGARLVITARKEAELETAAAELRAAGIAVTPMVAEWGIHGITVNAIGPGYFPSKMSRGLKEQHGDEGLKKNIPLQQVGDDEALKGAIVLFASDASKHTTGQCLMVDGGCSAMIAG